MKLRRGKKSPMLRACEVEVRASRNVRGCFKEDVMPVAPSLCPFGVSPVGFADDIDEQHAVSVLCRSNLQSSTPVYHSGFAFRVTSRSVKPRETPILFSLVPNPQNARRRLM